MNAQGTIYKVAFGHSIRYMRAVNCMAARVRAFKVWHARPDSIEPIGLCAPDIGAIGYNRACDALETSAATSAALRSMQSHTGADNTGRTFYKVSEAVAAKVDNEARAMLIRFGLA